MNPQTVLIVEDDSSIRDTLRLLLEDEGYVTLEARDGVECVDTLLLRPEQLVVLLDVVMPRMNGVEVLKFVAADAQLSAQHAYILMTATPDFIAFAGHRVNAILERLSVSILHKPFDIDAVVERVAQAARGLPANRPEWRCCDDSVRGMCG